MDTSPRFAEKKFSQGEYIIKEGDPGDFIAMITSGSADIVRKINGVNERIRIVSTGQIIGEMAVLSKEPRSASVIANEDVAIIVIQPRTLQMALMNDDLPIIYELIQQLVARLQETEKHMEEYLRVSGKG